MPICLYIPDAVNASRVEQTRMGMEAANPNNWSVGDIALVGGFIASAILWWKKNPWRKLKNMWQAPDRIEQILKKLDFILAGVNLATAMSQVTWQMLPRPVWQSDSNGNTVHANSYMLKLLCRQDDEILGDGWVNSVHEEDRERVQREWKNAVEHKRDFHLRYRWVTSAGVSIPIIAQAIRLMDTNGNVLGWCGFASLIDQ